MLERTLLILESVVLLLLLLLLLASGMLLLFSRYSREGINNADTKYLLSMARRFS